MTSNSKTDMEELTSLLSRTVEDLWSQAGRIGSDVKAAQDVAMTALAGGIVDDHKHIVGNIRVGSFLDIADCTHQIEKVVQVAASLPNDSHIRDDLSGQFIKTLWNGLKHPPISYLGDEFKYRAANGSNNVSDLGGSEVLLLIQPVEHNVSESWSCRKPLCQKCSAATHETGNSS